MTFREFTGTDSTGPNILCRGGFDSWGDGVRSPPTGGAYTEWPDNFVNDMGTSATLGAAGFGGNTVQLISAYWSPLAVDGVDDAELSILCAGLNNITLTEDTSTIIMAAFRSWMLNIQTPGHVICTIPPPYDIDPNREAVRKDVNARLRLGELGDTVFVCDLEPVLLNTTDNFAWKAEYLDDAATDAHPNEAGCLAVWDAIFVAIQAYQTGITPTWSEQANSSDAWT